MITKSFCPGEHHFIGDPPGLRGKQSETDCGKDEDIIALSNLDAFPAVFHGRER